MFVMFWGIGAGKSKNHRIFSFWCVVTFWGVRNARKGKKPPLTFLKIPMPEKPLPDKAK